MSDLAFIQPAIVDRLIFDNVPVHIVREMFNAAVAVGIAAGNGGYTTETSEADEFLGWLTDALDCASKYSVKVDSKTGLPV
jgi:hypothetical protein